jgi:hypothetical protein
MTTATVGLDCISVNELKAGRLDSRQLQRIA